MGLLPTSNCLSAHAPEKIAFATEDGARLTYSQLDRASLALADWFARHGLIAGDHIACMMGNRCELAITYWAAQRAGLYYTPIPNHSKLDEARYLAQDSGAKLIIFSKSTASMWRELQPELAPGVRLVCIDEGIEPFATLNLLEFDLPESAQGIEMEGFPMLYSSGTTGRPKGIIRPLSGRPFGTQSLPSVYREFHRMSETTVFLSPAPLYHAGPLRALLAVNRLGGTVVVMSRFDPLKLLQLVDDYGVTHLQLVPTMMRRLLELSDEVRAGFDLSSLECVIHAAAPCPPDLKRAMIDWLGPIVNEYYGGTEGAGMTYIDSEDWLAHPGSVGRAILGDLRICDDAGADKPIGETGLVCFADGPPFAYHNAPEKLAECRNAKGWVTLGDIGFVDAEGYLFLRDRRSFVINSGGVNIYPAEVESVIAGHPQVREVAVIGVPDTDLGEATKAVVETVSKPDDEEQLERDILAFTKARLSSIKAPKSVDFVVKLPCNEAGKVLKGEIRKAYWPDPE